MIDTKRLLEFIETPKTSDEHTICMAAFSAILDGESLDEAGLGAMTGLAPARVKALLGSLTERGLAVIDEENDRVVGSWGLSLVPTVHRLRIRERELYAWCALDAVGIPAALGEDGCVFSSCRQCEAPVHVEINAGCISRTVPAGLRLWLAANEAGRSVVGFT